MWQVQVVRRRTSRRHQDDGDELKAKLQVLKRVFVAYVEADALRLRVSGHRGAVWSSQTTPKQLVVRKRLVKVLMDNDVSIMFQLQSEDKALELATAAMETWGIEPQVHAEPQAVDEHRLEQQQMEELTELCMTNAVFRAQLQGLHGQLEQLWSF
ncbi:hypothetical protein Poli38472_008497 [Pythium oligandrum]|uniref:Uncharacterized protein n=1 Tax=Pythium oligandrum TaxID=41045 RepID=A0A8K1C3P0_PYTOL|nr:hypothetical protein Poli38472_008497 [Pythium oligandrum]|eukprot:TMW55849.1 hypothetical protein Poli38472_008497 [Pythium oligandrum]